MKIRSFQLKIALVSLLLSGLSLCLFGALAWTLFYRMGLDRIDLEIRGWGQKQLSKYRTTREWERFEQDTGLVFGQDQHRNAVILLVRDPQGKVVYQSAHWPQDLDHGALPSPALVSLPPPPPGRFLPPEEARYASSPEFRTYGVGNQTWRLGIMASEHVTLAMGISLEGFLAEMRQVRLAFLAALPAALLLVAAAGWLVSRRALQPVRRVAETARRITAHDLNQRIPAKTEDYEFEELVTVLNQMLDRLETSFQQAVRFSADAAHELRTPLTILQGELEQALREAPADSAHQRVYGDLMAEVLRLKSIVQKLLLLARADAGQLPLNPEAVDLVQLVEETIDDTAILAPHLKIEKDLIPEARVHADGELIRQVLQNLASNAAKYNHDGGRIVFALGQCPAGIRLTIANTGEPIPPGDRERIFNRFHRVDKSRGRHAEGVGLGLSLAREIVNAHHGTLTLDKSADGMTVFSLTLPPG